MTQFMLWRKLSYYDLRNFEPTASEVRVRHLRPVISAVGRRHRRVQSRFYPRMQSRLANIGKRDRILFGI